MFGYAGELESAGHPKGSALATIRQKLSLASSSDDLTVTVATGQKGCPQPSLVPGGP